MFDTIPCTGCAELDAQFGQLRSRRYRWRSIRRCPPTGAFTLAARVRSERRLQHKLLTDVILDVAYVGSSSTDLLRQVQINAVPFGATLAPQNQDPTRTPAAQLGSSALVNDFLRPFQGYGGIRMWDYSGYANYHALQTSVTRRFDRGFMFSGFWVWSKVLGINSTDFSAGVPNQTKEQTKALDYSLLDYDRPHNITLNAIYQTPSVTDSKALGLLLNEWQISGVYRWTSGRPYGVGFSIPGIGAANSPAPTAINARIVAAPTRERLAAIRKQLDTSFAPPKPGSNGNGSRFFVPAPRSTTSTCRSRRTSRSQRVKADSGRHVQR